MLIVGILATIAVPRLNIAGFRERGFIQQSLAAIRYAQKQAIASGCDVEVDITASECKLDFLAGGPGCSASSIINPITSNTDFCLDSDAPAGSTFPGTFSFDNIGRPSGGTQQFVLDGRTIQVEAETGYAREL